MEAVVLVVLQRRSGQRAVVLVVLWSMEEGWRTFALFKLFSFAFIIHLGFTLCSVFGFFVHRIIFIYFLDNHSTLLGQYATL